MSLVKKPTMTEKKIAANQRNGPLSQGAATEEGKGRIGAAQIRHGYYAQARGAALSCLGEDPAQYEELLQGLYEEFNPAGRLQEELVGRLARVLWLLDRDERSQEGHAVQRAQELNSGRSDRLHARMMRVKMTEESLELLVQDVADEHFVTTPAHLETMKGLHQEGVMKEMGEIALALFYELRLPGAGEDCLDPDEVNRRMVAQAKEIFGIGMGPYVPPGRVAPASPPEKDLLREPKPRITEAGWEARQRPRQLLENILRRQVEACKAQRKAAREESRRGPSPYERAAEIAPGHSDALMVGRVQDAYMREVRRIVDLLTKIQGRGRKKTLPEVSGEYSDTYDVLVNKGS